MTMTTNTLAAIAAGALLAAAAPASAVQFGPGTPEGYVAGLSGATEFGATDGTPGSITCPLCDSVVNFATYHNADLSDWRSDLGVSPSFLQGFDTNARWVFLYQIQNTNPLGGTNAELENFNVTTTDKEGDPVEENPYSSGGFINASALAPFNDGSLLDPDRPNDWEPGIVESKDVGSGPDDIDPTQVLFTNASGPNPIASASVRAGGAAYAGGLFEFGSPLIPANAFSEVLFLTANETWASYVWAETESPGGFGAAGDVPGIKPIPVPAPFLLLPAAMAALGFAAGRRRA